jgi:hypothetical protein
MGEVGETTICCRCERDDANYLDPNAKIWYSKCGHLLCERCKRELFQKHRMNKCPRKGCGITLGAQDFSAETKEQREYAEEKRVRDRLSKVFNKTLSDFNGNVAQYNDYLEHVETLVARLVTGSEREKAATEAEIAAYRETNKYSIDLNVARQHAAQQAARERLAAETAAREEAARRSASSEVEARRAADRVRSHIKAVLFGERRIGSSAGTGAGGDDEKEGIHALKQKLLELQQKRQQQKERGEGEGDVLAGAAAPMQHSQQLQAQPLQMFVPCGAVLPPRLVAYAHPSWMQLDTRQLPSTSLLPHKKACGYELSAIREREARDADTMLAASKQQAQLRQQMQHGSNGDFMFGFPTAASLSALTSQLNGLSVDASGTAMRD